MTVINRSDLEMVQLQGRQIQKAVGRGAFSCSEKMTVGYARYAREYGAMSGHQHAEETLLILDASRGRIRFGPTQATLDEVVNVEPGMVLHIPEGEWHVFEYDEDGFVEVLFIYGQVDNIRPEEAPQSDN